MSWEQPEPCRAGSSQGLTRLPSMPGRIGETEAGTGRAGRCFPWADPAFWSHSSPPWLALLGCHIPRLFLGVGQALSPSRASVSLFFQLLLPQQPLLLLSSDGRGRAFPVWGGGCWPLQSGCGVGRMGGSKLWSPLPSPRPTRTSLGTRNSWELLWELVSRPGGRDRGVSGGVGAGLQQLRAPTPAPCWDSQWPWGQT